VTVVVESVAPSITVTLPIFWGEPKPAPPFLTVFGVQQTFAPY
jgi:hypothetical protein